MSAVVLTAAMVARATNGHLVAGVPDRLFESVSIDSRAVEAGALFIAVRGERFDGHDFTDEAIARGAAGLLVSARPSPSAGDAAVILVADTLQALQSLGRVVRRESRARVVVVTGSAGKTTTKEATADLLSARYRVLRNKGNLNNHIGLPLSLLDLRDGPDVAVFELGMNHEGEIRTLVGIAQPDVRVWTNVGDAHIGYFGSREAIARAKAEVLEGASPATVVVANADDPLIAEPVGRSAGRRVMFGESPAATVRAVDVDDRGVDGTRARVVTPSADLRLTVRLPGRVHLLNVLAAVAAALELDVPVAAIESLVPSLRPFPRRGTVTTLAGGARLVDDSYNASPAAVRAMLTAMAATLVSGRRMAVLGEMLELGESARRLHEQCGAAAARSGIDELVVIGGGAASGLADGAVAAGLPAAHVYRFADSAEAAPEVAALVRSGDLVLVKGSRGTRLDLVSDRLLEVA